MSYSESTRDRPHENDKITVTIEIERTYVDNADSLTDRAVIRGVVYSQQTVKEIALNWTDPFDVSIEHEKRCESAPGSSSGRTADSKPANDGSIPSPGTQLGE